jgi:hypothetical protein
MYLDHLDEAYTMVEQSFIYETIGVLYPGYRGLPVTS